MNDSHDPEEQVSPVPQPRRPQLAPLPGEPGIPDVAIARASAMSTKRWLSLTCAAISLAIAGTFSIQRLIGSGKPVDDAESKRVGDRPVAATAEQRKLGLTPAPMASAPAAAVWRIPAIVPTASELAQSIGARRTGEFGPKVGDARSGVAM